MKYEIAWMCGHGTEVVAEANDIPDALDEAGRLLRLNGCLGVVIRQRDYAQRLATIRQVHDDLVDPRD